MRVSRGAALAGVVARGTPARAHWPRADGETGSTDSRRTVRRTRPGRARTFPAFSGTARPKPVRSDSYFRVASRGGNHAGVFAPVDIKGGWSAGRRAEKRGYEIATVRGS